MRSSPRKNSWKDPFPAGEGCGWTDHSFRIMNKKEGCFNLPPLIEAILPDPRDITLQRREKTGDFGFSLRRSVVVDRSSDQPSRYQLLSRLVLKIINKFNESSHIFFFCRTRVVIFAEPVFTSHWQSKFSQQDSAAAAALLLPGDRLLEVNGRNVQDTSREDIIDIIRQSGSSVTLRVCLFFLLLSFELSLGFRLFGSTFVGCKGIMAGSLLLQIIMGNA